MNDANDCGSPPHGNEVALPPGLHFSETPAQKDQRLRMVKEQLTPRGISAPAVLDAMAFVPRHVFVEPGRQQQAYSDNALPSLEGQTISQPFIVALMTQLLDLTPSHRVLEIGTGTGYQTAVLALLCAHVYSIERIPALGQVAQTRLSALGLNNISLKLDDGSAGWPEHQPFDRILVTAGAPGPPAPLLDQLALNGKLLIPLGRAKHQKLTVITRTANGFQHQQFAACRFVPLLGAYAWTSETYGRDALKKDAPERSR